MFRHRGKNRTFKHNLKLASLLSLVAGMVNVAGLFALGRLTTNVTGYFAFFADEVSKNNLWHAALFLGFIFAFFLGSFISSIMVEFVSRRNVRMMFIFPVALEITILGVTGFVQPEFVESFGNAIAAGLLFAMGMQNSLVTQISNSVVRTTHLTGLFTDLGIDLSQLLFYSHSKSQLVLLKNIRLKGTIVLFFFLGGIAGGIGFSFFGMYIFLIAATTLLIGVLWDWIRYRVFQMQRHSLR